jgi:hypothetical protein
MEGLSTMRMIKNNNNKKQHTSNLMQICQQVSIAYQLKKTSSGK